MILKFLFGGIFDSLTAVFEKFIEWLLGLFSFATIDKLYETFPIAENFFNGFVVAGWTFLSLIIVFSVVKSMLTFSSNEAENPVGIAIKAIPAAIMLATAKPIANVIINFSMAFYKDLMDISTVSHPLEDGVTGFLSCVGSMSLLGSSLILVQIILLLVMLIALVSFLLECLSRVAAIFIVQMMGPLIYPTMVSKNTASYFKNYWSLLAGHIFLMWSNGIFLKLIASGFAQLGNEVNNSFIFNYVMIIALILFGKKMDDLMAKLGFQNVRTGGLLTSFVITLGSLARSATGALKTLGSGTEKFSEKASHMTDTSGAGGSPQINNNLSAAQGTQSPNTINFEKEAQKSTAAAAAQTAASSIKPTDISNRAAAFAAASSLYSNPKTGSYLRGVNGQKVATSALANGNTDGLYKTKDGKSYGYDKNGNRVYANTQSGQIRTSTVENGIRSTSTFDSSGNLQSFKQVAEGENGQRTPVYSWNNENGMIEEAKYDSNGNLSMGITNDGNSIVENSYENGEDTGTRVFDCETGQMVSQEGYNSEGNWSKQDFENGKLASEEVSFDNDSGSISSITSNYDTETGALQSQTLQGTDGASSLKVTYGDGDSYSAVETGSDGVVTTSSVNESGTLTQTETLMPTGERTISSYGENGIMSSSTEYSSDGKMQSSTTYDFAGSPIESTKFNADGSMEMTSFKSDGSKSVSSYGADYSLQSENNYDAQGNIVMPSATSQSTVSSTVRNVPTSGSSAPVYSSATETVASLPQMNSAPAVETVTSNVGSVSSNIVSGAPPISNAAPIKDSAPVNEKVIIKESTSSEKTSKVVEKTTKHEPMQTNNNMKASATAEKLVTDITENSNGRYPASKKSTKKATEKGTKKKKKKR